MRLSDFAPRVNNVRVSGVGDTTCPEGSVVYGPTNTCTQTPGYRIEKVLGDYLQAAQLGQYGSPPPSPDQMASMLSSEAANICAQTFIPCDGSEQAIVQAYIQWYANWFNALPPVQSQPSNPAPNALNNNAPSGTPSITPSVALNKGQYTVGDTFQLVVMGTPGQPVTVVASHNGVTAAQTQMGTTDGSGRLVITGTMTADSVGNWSENWYVGGSPVGNVTFTVASNALAPPTTKPPVTAGQVLNNQTQGGSGALANGTSGSNTGTSTGTFDWLTKPISDSIPIPLWAALAGGVVALVVLKD